MPKKVTKLIHKYLRHDKRFPHVWCPGCGNGIVLGALIRAIDGLGLQKDEVVLASGIGCLKNCREIRVLMPSLLTGNHSVIPWTIPIMKP